MPITAEANEFVDLAEQHQVIDVRSPGEFAQGHIPGAHNVCLLDDEERAEVGVTYKRRGREAAIRLGRRIVEPKIPRMLDEVRSVCSDSKVLVHCWRGGLRSESVGRLLRESGYEARTLAGGYKAFRREVHRSFEEPQKLVMMSGLTGSGKTLLLHRLAAAGDQVIDLEGLAHHRGSAFGGIGQVEHPTVEQFENNLFAVWRKLDRTKHAWVESENHVIGGVVVPDPLWRQMLAAPQIRVEVSLESRLEILMDEYASFPRSELKEAVDKIKKRLGGDRHQRAIEALEQGDLRVTAEIVLAYYDKAYVRAQEKTQPTREVSVVFSPDSAGDEFIARLQRLAREVC